MTNHWPIPGALVDLRKAVADKAAQDLLDESVVDRLTHWKNQSVEGLMIPMAFPAALKFAGATVEDQVSAIFSEARELTEALMGPEAQDGTWLLELLDIQHAMETLYRILVNLYGPEALNVARAMVIEKNAARGYYLPPSVDD